MDNIKRKKKDNKKDRSKSKRKRSKLSPELKQKIKNIINIRINGGTTKGSNRIKTSRKAIPKRLSRDVASSDDSKRNLQQLVTNYSGLGRVPQVIQYQSLNEGRINDIIEKYQRLDRLPITNGEDNFNNRLRLIENNVQTQLKENQRLILENQPVNNGEIADKLQELQQQLMAQGSQLNEGSRVVQQLVADKMKSSIKKPRGRPKKDTPLQSISTHPFICEVEGCGKQFKREQDLKAHNTKIHKNDSEEIVDDIKVDEREEIAKRIQQKGNALNTDIKKITSESEKSSNNDIVNRPSLNFLDQIKGVSLKKSSDNEIGNRKSLNLADQLKGVTLKKAPDIELGNRKSLNLLDQIKGVTLRKALDDNIEIGNRPSLSLADQLKGVSLKKTPIIEKEKEKEKDVLTEALSAALNKRRQFIVDDDKIEDNDFDFDD